MPLKLKSFSQPDQLKRFQPGILSPLLEPFRLFFEMRGFSLPSPDGGEVDLQRLAGILAEPDEEMPSELVGGCISSSISELPNTTTTCSSWPPKTGSIRMARPLHLISPSRFG